MKNPARAFETGAKFGTAARSKNPKAASPTIPDVTKFYHAGEGLYLRKLFRFFDEQMSTIKLNIFAPLEPLTAT